jgi:transcriptional regulator with XRE-family HTH domain
MAKTKEYNSELIDTFFNEIERNSYEITKNRMLLALRIKDQIVKLGMSNTDLAKKLGKEKSVITKWLSGTHNFTSDTLFQIGTALNLDLVNLKDKSELVNPDYNITIELVPGSMSRTTSPRAPQSTVNNLPVKGGLC